MKLHEKTTKSNAMLHVTLACTLVIAIVIFLFAKGYVADKLTFNIVRYMSQRKILHDTVVDKYFFTIKDTLIHEIKASENDASYSLDLLMIAKYLERIGDHSCNVARCSQYMLTGKLTGQE